MKLKLGDVLIITIAALLSLGALLLFDKGGDTVTVTQAGAVIYTGRLGHDAVITTEDGSNTVCIENGRAYMQHADCPDGLCIGMGAAEAGRPVVCLPNKVVVSVSTSGEVDAVTW